MSATNSPSDGFWKSLFAFASFSLLMGYFFCSFFFSVVGEALQEKWRTRDELTVEAKLLHLSLEKGSSGQRTHVESEYSFGGKTYRGSNECIPGGAGLDYPVFKKCFEGGIPIRVYVDPSDPGYSVVDRSFHPVAVFFALVLFMILCGATLAGLHALYSLVREELIKLPTDYDDNQYLVPALCWFDKILGQQRDPSVNWPEFRGEVPAFDLVNSRFGELRFGDDVSKAGFLGKPVQMIWSRNGFYCLHYRKGGFELCFLDRKFHSVDFFFEPDKACPAPLGSKFGPVTVLHPTRGEVTLSAETTETVLAEYFGPPVATEVEGRDSYVAYGFGNVSLEFEMDVKKRRPRTLIIKARH